VPLDDWNPRIEQRGEAMDRRLDDNFDRMWIEFAALRGALAARCRLIAQIGWTLVGVFLAQTIAAIVALAAFA